RLLDSLTPPDSNTEAEWAEEIRSRVEEVRSGAVKPVSWATARDHILDDADGER
ncbi:MAG: addiction module protein, partial [Gemmataceae bacterium]|nr:addiction module protein [Gemmataceae bacterium]